MSETAQSNAVALTFENRIDQRMAEAEIDDLANYVMFSVQGLLTYSRLAQDPSVLRQYIETLIAFFELRLHGA